MFNQVLQQHQRRYTMGKAKTILVKAEMIGHGIVQFDSNDQKWVHNRCKDVQLVRHNNVNLGKASFKVIGKDAKGDDILQKTLKISGDGLRHAAHIEAMAYHTPNVALHPAIKVKFQGSVDAQQRGYFLADSKERRKSCYAITAATEISGARTIIETHARAGAKEVNAGKEVDDAGDTSFFARESVGETRYAFTAAISLEELGFIPISDLFDRRALVDDHVDAFRAELSQNIGMEVPAPAYFIRKGSAYAVPEKGIKLSDSAVKFLAIDLIKKLAGINIQKSQTGLAKVISLSVKVVSDPLVDIEEDPEGWITVRAVGAPVSTAALESVLDPDSCYVEVPLAEAEKTVQEFDAAIKAAVQTKRDDKKAKKEEKGEKKAAAKPKGAVAVAEDPAT